MPKYLYHFEKGIHLEKQDRSKMKFGFGFVAAILGGAFLFGLYFGYFAGIFWPLKFLQNMF